MIIVSLPGTHPRVLPLALLSGGTDRPAMVRPNSTARIAQVKFPRLHSLTCDIGRLGYGGAHGTPMSPCLSKESKHKRQLDLRSLSAQEILAMTSSELCKLWKFPSWFVWVYLGVCAVSLVQSTRAQRPRSYIEFILSSRSCAASHYSAIVEDPSIRRRSRLCQR